MGHKKLSFFFLFLLIGCGSLWAQENTSKRVKIGDNKKEKSGETPFKLPPPNSKNTPEKLLYPVAETLEKNGIKMLPDRTLVQAGAYLKIDPKIREKESKKAKNYFGNVNLGAVKTVSKFVGVVCRDHEYVDGDRVRIYLNGDIVAQNLFLTAGFQ